MINKNVFSDEAWNEIIGKAIGCDTVLIALCRAIVVAVLGKEAQVPAMLVKAA